MAADTHEKGLEHKLWQTNESYLINGNIIWKYMELQML
jgi:hypothetical protein